MIRNVSMLRIVFDFVNPVHARACADWLLEWGRSGFGLTMRLRASFDSMVPGSLM